MGKKKKKKKEISFSFSESSLHRMIQLTLEVWACQEVWCPKGFTRHYTKVLSKNRPSTVLLSLHALKKLDSEVAKRERGKKKVVVPFLQICTCFFFPLLRRGKVLLTK